MTTLFLDLETYSPVPITHGTHAYAEQAEVMLFAWALDDAPVQVWDCTKNTHGVTRVPIELLEALEDPDVLLCAHNSHFDRTVLRLAGPCKAAKAAAQQIERWRDTMVQALAHGLPGSLGELCTILRVPVDQAKDKEGRQLVHLFCKPRPFAHRRTRAEFDSKAEFDAWVATTKAAWAGRATSATHPAEWAKFVEYARLDVEAMRVVAGKLPRWNDTEAEHELWVLDQTVNDRGVAIDVDLAEAAVRAVAREQDVLAQRCNDLTDGSVNSATRRDALLEHLLLEYGIDLPDLQKATLERRIADPDLPDALRELLRVRLAATTTSTSKYKTLVKGTSRDGRLRGTLQFCGASRTGRWAGRLFQPQNLPRPSLDQAAIDEGIELLKLDCADLLAESSVMELTSSAVRGALIAPPGRKLVVADLANIEGRMLAWLAGESWKLRAFREFDAGRGPDLYKAAYAKAFAVAPDDVAKDQRQIGKVMELMLGYEGGVGAFLTGAATYGIDLDAMAESALPGMPADVIAEAESFLAWRQAQKLGDFGLSHRAFIACDAIKRLWRAAHPATASLWADVQESAIAAVLQPGAEVTCRRLRFKRTGTWLRVVLPSGRNLCYPGAAVGDDGKLSYLGVNQYSRKWGRLKTYGGKLVENITQAAARDVLASSMPAIEQAGYQIVLTVHDEVICEAPDTPEFNHAHLAGLMATNPSWAEGLPLAAAGFDAYRYRKE